MLTGEYFHSIDAKGRMNFPSKLRDELGEQFYVTSWFDDCLAVFSKDEFEKICEKLTALGTAQTRVASRRMGGNATMVEPDKQGRILIPASLREKAGIQGEVAVVGVLTRAEIWDKDRWITMDNSMDAESFEQNMLENNL